MNQIFDFGEALSMMRAGLTVTNPTGRRYRIKDGVVICLPKPDSNSSYKVVKWFPDAVMSTEWSLAAD